MSAMKFRFLVKLPDHKTFSYIPRFYDAEREEREKRIRAIEKGLQSPEDTEAMRERFASAFQRKKQADTSPIMVRLIIVALLMFVIFVVLSF
jgi:hypothetical protein